jgi:hypothetical protein
VQRAFERRTVKPSSAASNRQASFMFHLSPPSLAYARTRVCGGMGETRET